MDAITHLWDEFWAFFHEGLPHLNLIQGLVIALIGGLMVSSFVGLFFTALIAVIVYILADALIPVVMNHAAFKLPVFDHAFFHYALALYIAYFVVIGAIYVVRLMFAAVRG
jgi:hypothetical protein